MLLLSIHVRHGCYLMQGHYTCLGTKETLSEMLGMMDKSPSTRMKEHDERNRRSATGPGHPARPRTSGPSRKPEHLAPITERPEAEPRQPGHPARGPDIRLFPSRRTSGPQPGHPDPAYPESSETGHSSPDIRPASPDIRHLAKARTSGPTPGHPAPLPACSASGPRPMYPFAP